MLTTLQELIQALAEYDQTAKLLELETAVELLTAELAATREEIEQTKAYSAAKKEEVVRLWKLLGEHIGTEPAPEQPGPEEPAPVEYVNDPVGTFAVPGAQPLKTSSGIWSLGLDGKITRNGNLLPETNSVTRLEVVADGSLTTIRQFAWGTSWLYKPSDLGANLAGWVEAVAVIPEQPVDSQQPAEPGELTLFPTQPVQRWNYNQVYHPIEGAQPGKFPPGFTLDFFYIKPNAQGELVHELDGSKGSAIKWEAEKKLRKTQGHYVVEATINRVAPGVVYAPLWLYSEGAAEPYHEYDFEYMNGRLEYNLHNGRGGFNMRKVDKDLTGHRVRYEIIRTPGLVTMRATSLTDGWTDELVITPSLVSTWATQTGAPPELRFPADNIAMYPVTELWISKWPAWSGTWDPATQVPITMTLHGYSFT